jgi:hypothetical protein
MKSIRYAVLCLVAMLAITAAVLVPSASAKEYGFYKDGTTEAATGYKYKYKLAEGTGKVVTSKNGAIECTGMTGLGEVKTLNNAEGEIIFTGCSFSGIKCNSTEPKGKEGEIIAREVSVSAVLERLSSSEKEPALLSKPLKEISLECTALEKLSSSNTAGTSGGLLVLMPKAASEGNGWLGREGLLFDLAFEQSNGVQKGSGEFMESETGEIMKAGLTLTGSGIKNFKEGVALEAKFSIEFEKAVSIFA